MNFCRFRRHLKLLTVTVTVGCLFCLYFFSKLYFQNGRKVFAKGGTLAEWFRIPYLNGSDIFSLGRGSEYLAYQPLYTETKDRDDVIPTAYVITPTYRHLTQEAELKRLCYTLMHVRKLHWVVVEDSANKTALVSTILRQCQAPSLTFTHLTALTPNSSRHRGLAQRNTALNWIRHHVPPGIQAGGVYFADDDNTYDVRLFEAVRRASKVSVWLVGLVAGALYEGPICSNGKVTGWRGRWAGSRRFPLDMAGFAVGVPFLLRHPNSSFTDKTAPGYLEDAFLRSFNLTLAELTPGTDPDCKHVFVWHTKTKKPVAKQPKTFRNNTKTR